MGGLELGALCESIQGLLRYVIHLWMMGGLELGALCQSIRELLGYVIHPGMILGWAG